MILPNKMACSSVAFNAAVPFSTGGTPTTGLADRSGGDARIEHVDANADGAGALDALRWPPKLDLFGVQVSATDYAEATELILDAARRRTPAVVSLHAAHAVVTASRDPALLEKVNQFQMVAPDGQPVRWALNLLYRAGLRDRVYGPELMLRLCKGAAERQVPIYLYGSTEGVLEALRSHLCARYPGLQVVGAESPPFRALAADEEDAVVRRINESGAGIVFVGLGCPKQDHFAHGIHRRVRAVLVCVGAAFDFHAGAKPMAPRWMQRMGVEWAYRLCCEPGRLWRRYLVTNTLFLGKFTAVFLRRGWAFFSERA